MYICHYYAYRHPEADEHLILINIVRFFLHLLVVPGHCTIGLAVQVAHKWIEQKRYDLYSADHNDLILGSRQLDLAARRARDEAATHGQRQREGERCFFPDLELRFVVFKVT